jgi:hypothetical protein
MKNPTVKVFWMDTDGGEPGDGAWYWKEIDENGETIDDPVGPFMTAVQAGRDAREFVIKFSNEQAYY